MWLASPLDVKGPASATICISSQVGDDPGDLSATSSPSNCLSLLPISSHDGGALPEGGPSWEPLLFPTLALLLLSPSEMEKQLIRGHGRLFKVACAFFILISMDSLSWIEVFLERWQRSGAKLHVFWRGRTGSSKRL